MDPSQLIHVLGVRPDGLPRVDLPSRGIQLLQVPHSVVVALGQRGEGRSGGAGSGWMLGRRSPQGDLFRADTQYLRSVGVASFYGLLAREGRRLLRDEDFAALYRQDNGRNRVPPSLLAIALLLQTHDRVSDDEAKALHWKPVRTNRLGRAWKDHTGKQRTAQADGS